MEVELPTEDLTSSSFERFVVARSEGAVVGVIGFEIHGALAVARSLAVSSSFRKQGIASALLIEAERLAVKKWGPGRAYTYIDPRKIQSDNPGCCFKKAGWKFEKISKTKKHLLVKYLEVENEYTLQSVD